MMTLRVFCASIATETNSFSPLRTDFTDFETSFYAPPGAHPETPTLCSAVYPALRARARNGEIELIEGTATWAEPGGTISEACWTRLRDEVLQQLREALTVDAVLLGLHGAMMSEKTLDCEGELIAAARALIGPDTALGVTFDPHSHLSPLRTRNADIITVFKEFPHTDFVETAEACVALTLAKARGMIAPRISVADAGLIDLFPTSLDPMRSFVDKLRQIEEDGRALSVSAIHGFMAGDSPNLGARILVITDHNAAEGEALARSLADELYSFRGKARPEFLLPDDALDRALASSALPVIVADVWDNPGGGVAGDSTILLRKMIERGMTNAALGTIWDPMAVRICFAAGTGAALDLRFGGKTSAHAGAPIDATVRVKAVQRNAVQSFGASIVPLGDCAVIDVNGIEVVLNTNRAQTFSPDLFTNLGIDLASKQVVVVKSTNHFHGAFAPVAGSILYAAVDGPYPNDPSRTPYQHFKGSIWPMSGAKPPSGTAP